MTTQRLLNSIGEMLLFYFIVFLFVAFFFCLYMLLWPRKQDDEKAEKGKNAEPREVKL